MIEKCYLIEPFTCNQNDTVAAVAKKLKEYGQRHIYVINEENKPIGFISVTDILNKIVIENKNVADFTAKDIMTSEVLSFDDKDDVKKAYKAMVDKGVVSCAITEDGKMIGSLSLKESLRYITNPENA